VLLCSGVVACHRPTEVRGIYVSQNGVGTFFPCDDPKSAGASTRGMSRSGASGFVGATIMSGLPNTRRPWTPRPAGV